MTRTRRFFARLVAITCLFGATITGVAAQSEDSETISVVLGMETVCAVDLSWAGGGFGTWYRVGEGWSYQPPMPVPGPTPPQGTPPAVLLQASITSRPSYGCDVSVSFAGLKGAGGAIPPTSSYFTALSTLTSMSLDPAGWTHDAVTDSEFFITYLLNAVPADLPNGKYEGEVTVTVTNAA
jgi:hypothetical protein